MNFPLFIAKRIYFTNGDRHEVSRPAIRIATVGVAIGLAVMIITVSVIFGFKHTIRDKVVGFGSHIQITNFVTQQTSIPAPIVVSDTLMRNLKKIPNVKRVECYAMTQGILKTDSDFLGVAFKGVGEDYDLSFVRENMQEGKIPTFSSKKSSYQLLISRKMADKLHLHVGDKVYAYFIAYDDVRARRFTISGIYQSNMKQFDDVLCITDLHTACKLNDWEKEQYTGAEILVNDFEKIDETNDHIIQLLKGHVDRHGETLASQTIYEAYPQIFSWLSLLDINVWIILALMICVAGFTMISGLLIIILERTQMIGILKAIGARNDTVRHTFLWFAAFIISQGLLIGDVLGIGLVLIQQHTGFIHLDPSSYYVDTAPMELNIPIIIALNVATLLISVFVLIAPSYLVSHIRPAKAMQFD
ncbi:lipoprotein-releasing system permease protein [Prevotellaceae bacterium MN60]|nr:lipoprotein-releasing system permease protein [Prevotellaceae bacterium MN60]